MPEVQFPLDDGGEKAPDKKPDMPKSPVWARFRNPFSRGQKPPEVPDLSEEELAERAFAEARGTGQPAAVKPTEEGVSPTVETGTVVPTPKLEEPVSSTGTEKPEEALERPMPEWLKFAREGAEKAFAPENAPPTLEEFRSRAQAGVGPVAQEPQVQATEEVRPSESAPIGTEQVVQPAAEVKTVDEEVLKVGSTPAIEDKSVFTRTEPEKVGPDILSVAEKVAREGAKIGDIAILRQNWLALGHTEEEEKTLFAKMNADKFYRRLAQDILDANKRKESGIPTGAVPQTPQITWTAAEDVRVEPGADLTGQGETKPVVSEVSDFDKWVEERRLGLEKGETPVPPPILKGSIFHEAEKPPKTKSAPFKKEKQPYVPKSPRIELNFSPEAQASLGRVL
ncbi:MAG: hypothetical protein ABH816_01310 [Candidatus Levyibacteriota bacterium]